MGCGWSESGDDKCGVYGRSTKRRTIFFFSYHCETTFRTRTYGTPPSFSLPPLILAISLSTSLAIASNLPTVPSFFNFS